MTAVAAPVPPLPPSPPTVVNSKMDLHDFPDRMSPMVVKELRQGLRAPLFVWAFILVHLILVMVVLAGLDDSSRRGSSEFFWWAFVLPVVLLMPMRGINALTDEVRMRTMETLLLTRLSALRICLGKWVAIIAQIWLIGLTVLPYLIMRYFSGGLDLWTEIKWLFHFLVLASCFAAATVGFSWQKHFLLRGITTLGLAFAVGMLCGFIIEVVITRNDFVTSSLGSHETAITLFSYLVLIYLGYYFLDYAAAQIAPLAENRSTMRRIITLATAVVLCLVVIWDEDFSYVCIVAQTIMLILAGADAATERTKHVSVIVQPFVKRGWPGKIAGRLLYPGWHSGYFFLHLLAGLTIFSIFYRMWEAASSAGPGFSIWAPHFGREVTLVILVIYGQVALGLLMQRRFFGRAKAPLAVFIINLGSVALLHLLVTLLSHVGGMDKLNYLMFWSPLNAYMVRDDSAYYYSTYHGPSSNLLLWTTILAGIYSLIMFILVKREFSVTSALEKQVESDLAEDAAAQSMATPE